MQEQKGRRLWKVVFLAIGFATVLEFLFVRGMFTWIIAVAATAAAGIVNIVLSLRDRRFLDAALYLLSGVALCMGYFVIGG